jgi:hypothetical protein
MPVIYLKSLGLVVVFDRRMPKHPCPWCSGLPGMHHSLRSAVQQAPQRFFKTSAGLAVPTIHPPPQMSCDLGVPEEQAVWELATTQHSCQVRLGGTARASKP